MEGCPAGVPRVDSGFHVIDLIPHIDKILAEISVEELVSWVLREKTIIVSSPSIVTVRLDGGRTASIVLSVGSMISRNPPPLTRIPVWTMASTGWVDGCVASRTPKVSILESTKILRVEGVIRAIDYKDAVALSINGLRGVHVIAETPRDKAGVVAVVDNIPVVMKTNDGYEIALIEGIASARATLVASLISSCGGGE